MKLLGTADLAKRWNYTKQGVHQKMKQDENFPKPIGKINQGILVFLEDDIALYEKTRKEFFDAKYKHWYTQLDGIILKPPTAYSAGRPRGDYIVNPRLWEG